jgi:hypothetical protein
MGGHIKYTAFLTFLLFITLQLSNTEIKAQGASGSPEQAAPEGTYQFVFNSKNDQHAVQLSNQELIKIEQLRKDDEVVFAFPSYSDHKTIRILSRNQINQGGFQPAAPNYYKDEQPYDEIKNIRYIVFD